MQERGELYGRRISSATLAQLPASVNRAGTTGARCVRRLCIWAWGRFTGRTRRFTEAVLASGDLAWGIVGAGMQSSGMRDALLPQDNLYVLSEVGADSERLSVIGAIVDVIGGAEDSEKARLLAKMSDISTRIVSLTVTEKGYYLDLATGQLQLQNPAIAGDLARPNATEDDPRPDRCGAQTAQGGGYPAVYSAQL